MADTGQEVNTSTLVKVYLKIRGAKERLAKEYDSKLAELDAQLKTIHDELRERMQAEGVKSMRTEFGTPIMSLRTRYWTGDWDGFKQFIKDFDALDLFEKRIAQGNMAKFLEEHPDITVPGLNVDSEYVVTVRKPD